VCRRESQDCFHRVAPRTPRTGRSANRCAAPGLRRRRSGSWKDRLSGENVSGRDGVWNALILLHGDLASCRQLKSLLTIIILPQRRRCDFDRKFGSMDEITAQFYERTARYWR